MMNTSPLERMLQLLLDLRASMQATANTSAIRQLDEAIFEVQKAIESEDKKNNARELILNALAKLFEKLPSIVTLLKFFDD